MKKNPVIKKTKAESYMYYDVRDTRRKYGCIMGDEEEMEQAYLDYGYLDILSPKGVEEAVTKMLNRFNRTKLVVKGKLFAPPVRMYCILNHLGLKYQCDDYPELAQMFFEQCERMETAFYSNNVDYEAKKLISCYLD